jgi:hypothetical protein
LKNKKGTRTRRHNRARARRRARRPRNVWNSLRKLQNYLRKADIHANIFMEVMSDLREAISFETKSSLIDKLCGSVQGDLLIAIRNYQKMIEEKQRTDGKDEEAGSILLGVFEVLAKYLDLRPCKSQGERFFVSPESAKNFDFEEIPEKLEHGRVQRVEVEVLRCGWKIGEKIVRKPRVFSVS